VHSKFATGMFSTSAALALALLGVVPACANDAMWAKLAEGGKVVLMRHASVVSGRGGGNSLLRDPTCKKERNLSDEGKNEARVIGEGFRKHNIPVEEVRYSPYCRTADTAKIAFDRGTEAAYLSLLEVLGAQEAAAQTAELNKVIGAYTGKGNLVLITHEPNINAVSFEMMKPADFLVLQPKGDGSFDELGVVRSGEAN